MLTGPTQSEHTGPVEFPWERLVQIDPIFRSERKYVKARGNRSSQITFSCLRRYDTLLAAMQARATLIDSLPGEGELELTQYAGGSTLTIVSTVVLASTPAPELIGRAVRFHFAFVATSLNSEIVAGEGAYLRNENGSIIRNEDGTPILAS